MRDAIFDSDSQKDNQGQITPSVLFEQGFLREEAWKWGFFFECIMYDGMWVREGNYHIYCAMCGLLEGTCHVGHS